MKHFTFSLLFLIFSSLAIGQQRPTGIKLLVKDKFTGNYIKDSVRVIFNDSIKPIAVSGIDGNYVFPLPPGIYVMQVDRIGYQSQLLRGIRLLENGGTHYVTVELSDGRDNSTKIKAKKKKPKKRKKKK